MKIKIINCSKNPLPAYATAGSAGLDLLAANPESIILHPLERALVPTGIHIELPLGYEAQLRPRSGLALKHGLTLLNSPATIDSDYRGEIQVLIINLGNEPFTIESGMRIAQMVVAPVTHIEWETAVELKETGRGSNGFGHTGLTS